MFDRVSVYEKFQKEINEKPRFSLGLHPGGQGIICFFQTEISGETLPFLFPWRDQETTMVREFQLALGWIRHLASSWDEVWKQRRLAIADWRRQQGMDE